VATDTEANRLILDQDCARLCEFEVSAFTRAILDLVNDDAMRDRLAKNAFRKYKDKFNFGMFTRLLGEAYQDMLGNKPSTSLTKEQK